jgi:hypothetical protein
MANATFKSIDEFIDGFTKTDAYAKTLYDGIIHGMEFTYGGHFYRLTRDRSPDEKTFVKIRKKFNKPDGYYIEVYRLPCEDHGGRYELNSDIYLGLYDDVDDLLDHCIIDGKSLREIIPSEKTRICSVD